MAAALPERPALSNPPGNMLVGVIAAPHRVEMISVPVPIPGPSEVLVRIRATAICTYEQRTYSGQQANTFPWLGGHEIAGEIAAVGSEAIDSVRVAIGWRSAPPGAVAAAGA